MNSSRYPSNIPLDHTEIALSDIEDDSPVVRAAITNLQKRTNQLQKLSKAVLHSVTGVKEALDSLNFKEACLDASLADLATLLPAFGETALPPLLARRRALAGSRKQEKAELSRNLERPLKTISDQCKLVLSKQMRYELQSKSYYSATHRWLGEGAISSAALSSGSSPSRDASRIDSSSQSQLNFSVSHPEEQRVRELRFLLTRLDLYDQLLQLHGGEAELSLVLPAANNGNAYSESIAESMNGLFAAEKDKVENRKSACRHRIANVKDELRLSDAVIQDLAPGGKEFDDLLASSKQAQPKSPPAAAKFLSALPAIPRRHSARPAPGSQEQARGQVRSTPPSPSSPGFMKPLSNALQRFKSGHTASSSSLENGDGLLDNASSTSAERASITSRRLSFNRLPSDSRSYWPPRRSVSLKRGSDMIPGTSSSSDAYVALMPREGASTPTSPSLVRNQPFQSPTTGSVEDHFHWRRTSFQGFASKTPSPRPHANALSLSATHDAAWSHMPSLTSPSPPSRPPPSPSADMSRSVSSPARKKEGTLWVMGKQVTSDFSSEAPRSAKKSSLWSEAWVVLSGSGHLSEHTGWRGKKTIMTPTQPMIDLQFATVRETRAVERKFVFEVVTRHGRRLYQASTESGMQEWIKAISNAIESLCNGTSSIRQVDKVARTEGLALAATEASFKGLIGSPRWSENLSELGIISPSKLFGNGKEQRRLRSSAAFDDGATSTGSDIEVMAETSSSGISNKTPLSQYVPSSRRESGVRSKLKHSTNDDAAIDLRIEAAVHSSFGSGSKYSGGPQSAPCSSSKRFSLDVPTSDWHRQTSSASHARTQSAVSEYNDGSRPPSVRRALAQEIDCLSRLPVNSLCADCRKPNPRWASWSLCESTCCVFVCITCAGMHRSLGVHLSKVKSVDLDDWTEEQVDNARQWNNVKANAIWEELRKIGSSSELRNATSVQAPRKGEKDLWNVKYVQQAWRTEPFGPLDPSRG
ncbi:hypothetical protein BCV69DRAFT_210495 [Microstroma glucosiphilum]|uniref:ArfGap-domain-containing protein n=1 Tax=Pseudomicrostroma glucosiphilum TaxID=1684307 RepID=A0A316U5F2_9BASI|nr:hypothetical protein BCV69DRAFT_210495 [Pseudomicrostroma glucosiphilum]PWN20456.1 hypothetical protein BCV69DRAFT_210495 [Pseudomicrostroma glucosiphilum]